MNKYKMAVSCGRGMGIVKNTSKTWGDIAKKLSTHVELDDKEKAGFFVGGEFSSEKRKDEFCFIGYLNVGSFCGFRVELF